MLQSSVPSYEITKRNVRIQWFDNKKYTVSGPTAATSTQSIAAAVAAAQRRELGRIEDFSDVFV